MLTVDNINVGYEKTQILHDLSFEIEKGTVTTLLGGNGVGKTTTLKALSGMLRAKTGSITFLGHEITRKDMSKIVSMGIVHVPEQRELFTQMTVFDNLELGACLRNDKSGIKRDIERTYDLFPILESRRNMQAGYLSGGEQQMLAIARGLMAQPKLLMLDEPSAGLAPIVISKIAEIIRVLNQQRITILLVEQNVRLALAIARFYYIIGGGEIIHQGECRETQDEEIFKKFIH